MIEKMHKIGVGLITTKKYDDLYIGGVREGGFIVARKIGNKYMVIRGFADCCNDALQLIHELGVEITTFIELSVITLWEEYKSSYSFPKCLGCIAERYGLDGKETWIGGHSEPYCLGGKNGFEYAYKKLPKIEHMNSYEFNMEFDVCASPMPQERILSFLPEVNFNDFDITKYQTNSFRLTNCYLTKVNQPKLDYFDIYINNTPKEFVQDVVIGNPNTTKKTIKARICEKYIDPDKWEKGSKIELVGTYVPHNKVPLRIEFIKLVDSPKLKPKSQPVRNTVEYNKWRDEVIEVGECFMCGRKNHLQAHHINSVADFPEQALDVSNGVCLCKACHDVYHEDYSNTGDANSFMKFVRDRR